VVCDWWREAGLRQALEAIRLPPPADGGEGRQGYKYGGDDVRALRRAILGGHVRAVESLLLWATMSEARTLRDPAGNEKALQAAEGGRRHRARDDAAAAAILAAAEGYRRWIASPPARRPLRSALVG